MPIWNFNYAAVIVSTPFTSYSDRPWVIIDLLFPLFLHHSLLVVVSSLCYSLTLLAKHSPLALDVPGSPHFFASSAPDCLPAQVGTASA
jgi:hypothetical protein